MILVDSSVILDIFTQDKTWFGWSSRQILALGAQDVLAINPVVYSEVTIRLSSPADADRRLISYQRLPLPYEAAYWAGKVFLKYKSAGGKKIRPLPDFYIGAHAYVAQAPLLTRDPARVRQYFPSVTLIQP